MSAMRVFWDECQRGRAPRHEFFNGGLHPATYAVDALGANVAAFLEGFA